jgi:hypothetical protein
MALKFNEKNDKGVKIFRNTLDSYQSHITCCQYVFEIFGPIGEAITCSLPDPGPCMEG